jgi:CheY-like chemotaxis protein
VSVTGFAELARAEAGGNVKLKEYLDQISKAGQRARNLIRQLLVYSRGDTDATAAVVDLVPQLDEVLSMLRPMLSTRVEIKNDWPASSPMVRVDPVHLQQLLMNLSINARDAMPPGGALTISVRRQSFHGEECQICHDRVQGEWVCIRVQDSGTGISPHLLDKIFQPFYTTKEIGSGGGMGLAVVQGIVSTYRGHILVESRVGEGTRFDILLPPASDSEDRGESAREVLADQDLRDRRILVVDDEAVVRLFLSRVLTAAKADIVLCASGAEALEAFRNARDEFSLLLTDQSMPGMSGVGLVREIRKLDTSLPVLIFSGYAGAVGERDISELRIDGVLMKPLTPDELVAAINRALAPR